MQKRHKRLLLSLAALCLVLAVAIQFTVGWRPFLGPRKRALTNRHFEATPQRLARGRYLTQGLLGCESCHTPRDWIQPRAPPVARLNLPGQKFHLTAIRGSLPAPHLT